MAIVLDSSMALSWLFADEGDEGSDAVLDRLAEEEAIVPSLWPLEVANALLVGERQGRVARSDSVGFIELLDALPITSDLQTFERPFRDILPLSREEGLSLYDGAYLELALRLQVPLATKDVRLAKAADRLGLTVLG